MTNYSIIKNIIYNGLLVENAVFFLTRRVLKVLNQAKCD